MKRKNVITVGSYGDEYWQIRAVMVHDVPHDANALLAEFVEKNPLLSGRIEEDTTGRVSLVGLSQKTLNGVFGEDESSVDARFVKFLEQKGFKNVLKSAQVVSFSD